MFTLKNKLLSIILILTIVFVVSFGSVDTALAEAETCINNGTHEYSEVVTEATCTEKGYTKHTCSICGDSFIDDYKDALGHIMGENIISVPNSCTADGVEKSVCKRNCGHEEISKIPAAHSYIITVLPATCTEDIKWIQSCVACDDYEETVVNTVAGSALGHRYGEWKITKEPKCTDVGVETRICTVCEASEETREVEALGHDYEKEVHEPSCEEEGYTTYTCNKCDDSYKDSFVDSLGHSFGKWTTRTEATCTKKGVEYRTCTVCGIKEETRKIAEKGHKYKSVVTPSTCIASGFTTYICDICEDHYIDTITAPLGHSYTATVKDATCTSRGYTVHRCETCGHSYRDTYTEIVDHNFEEGTIIQQGSCTEAKIIRCKDCDAKDVLAPNGHAYEDKVVAPTCTEDGYTIHACKCGDNYKDSIVNALGHVYGQWITIEEASCTEDGVQQRICTVESCADKQIRTIKATGHAMGSWEQSKAPTCTQDGENVRKCEAAGCGYFETTSVAATGHSYKAEITEPTCTSKGYTTHRCEGCGGSYVDSYVDANGHSHSKWAVVVSATCTAKGEKLSLCDICGKDPQTKEIPEAGHNYISVETKATCETGGYITHTCDVCDDKYVDSHTEKLGHSFSEYIYNEDATCTKNGTQTAKCDRCDARDTKTVAGSKLQHTWGDWIIEKSPTCTEEGYRAIYCTAEDCKTLKHGEILAPTGHTYGAWETTKAPTCTEKGEKIRSCTVTGCNYKQTGVIGAEGHKSVIDSVKSPTCTEKGLSAGAHCEECGEVLKAQVEIEPMGHAFADYVYDQNSETCTEDGTETGKCERCDKTDTRKADGTAKGHALTIVFDQETKNHHHECSDCSFESEPEECTFDEGTVVKEATEECEGERVHTCSVCSGSYVEIIPVVELKEEVKRVYGDTRYETAFKTADLLKEELGVEKFEAVIITTGNNYADALTGSYLAGIENAPILLSNGKNDKDIKEYILENLADGGKIYLLGGTAVVGDGVISGLSGYEISRLWGKDRYETNLAILDEMGIEEDVEIMVCSGESFADSISASATGRPLLIVKSTLTSEQIQYLERIKDRNCTFVIIGGAGVVSSQVENMLAEYGTVDRIGGTDRYDTSINVAKRFFDKSKKAVVAYALDYPNGTCASVLAQIIGAPLVLMSGAEPLSVYEYMESKGIKTGIVIGSETMIYDEAVKAIFSMAEGALIEVIK